MSSGLVTRSDVGFAIMDKIMSSEYGLDWVKIPYQRAIDIYTVIQAENKIKAQKNKSKNNNLSKHGRY